MPSKTKVLKDFNKETLPILYNVNIGCSQPMGILSLGPEIEVGFAKKKVYLRESLTANS